MIQVAFAVHNSRKMFLSRQTLCDFRILLVIPAAMFMTYYETFWFFYGFTMFESQAEEKIDDGLMSLS